MMSVLEELLHVYDTVTTNEDLTDKMMIATVIGMDDDEQEPTQIVSYQDVLQTIVSPWT